MPTGTSSPSSFLLLLLRRRDDRSATTFTTTTRWQTTIWIRLLLGTRFASMLFMAAPPSWHGSRPQHQEDDVALMNVGNIAMTVTTTLVAIGLILHLSWILLSQHILPYRIQDYSCTCRSCCCWTCRACCCSARLSQDTSVVWRNLKEGMRDMCFRLGGFLRPRRSCRPRDDDDDDDDRGEQNRAVPTTTVTSSVMEPHHLQQQREHGGGIEMMRPSYTASTADPSIAPVLLSPPPSNKTLTAPTANVMERRLELVSVQRVEQDESQLQDKKKW